MYQPVQEHIGSFFAQVEAGTGSGLSDFVKDEFEAFLECGILAAALIPRPRLNLIRFHGVLAPNAKLRAEIIPGEKKNKSKPADDNDDVPHSPTSVCISWAHLLKQVFEVDIEHCPHCGGTLKIVAAILEKATITKILDHLDLSAQAKHTMPTGLFAVPPSDPAIDTLMCAWLRLSAPVAISCAVCEDTASC